VIVFSSASSVFFSHNVRAYLKATPPLEREPEEQKKGCLPVRARRSGDVVVRVCAGGKRGKLWDDAGGGLAEGDTAGQQVSIHSD
jgi:hypothetical protein